MKIPFLLPSSLLLALALSAVAQPDVGLPRVGTGAPLTAPRVREETPEALATTATSPEPANITYNWTMPVDQVLDLYRTWSDGRRSGMPSVSGTTTITLKTKAPLTHSEAVQALETILRDERDYGRSH